MRPSHFEFGGVINWLYDAIWCWHAAGVRSESLVWEKEMRVAAAAFVAIFAWIGPEAFAETGAIPDLSFGGAAWQNMHNDFILPSTGPGPVTWDPKHPYVGNNEGRPPTVRVADVTNPILMPWVKEELQKFNQDALAGKAQYTPISRCRPAGVPGAILLRLNPMFIVQAPGEVMFLYQSDDQVRHIYMNCAHSAQVLPSWYGESVGHYEGDTLVVDTIGVTSKVATDYYLTPHTDQLHVVERYHVIDGGNTLEVSFTVDDPGAFNMPWSASQRYKKTDAPFREVVCAEGEAFAPNQDRPKGLVPIPTATIRDF